ncbi:MAG: PxKF domain-containing protein [Gammaproteobacteria bacterium]|nr:PxKF domain-containing protein [Gammaproteobacteria bacterium]
MTSIYSFGDKHDLLAVLPVTNLASVTVTAASLSCSLGTTPDQIEEYAAGASGLQNLGNGNYQFNWKTPKSYANSCKTLKLDLGEGAGQERTALFQFTR